MNEFYQYLAATTAIFILVGIPAFIAFILFLVISFIDKK